MAAALSLTQRCLVRHHRYTMCLLAGGQTRARASASQVLGRRPVKTFRMSPSMSASASRLSSIRTNGASHQQEFTLYNSMSKSKTLFTPLSAEGKTVTMYVSVLYCGVVCCYILWVSFHVVRRALR
jgi:hypothetical protein